MSSTPTYCDRHERARFQCGCPWADVAIAPEVATFVACIEPRRADIVRQLREAHEMPPGIPVKVIAGNMKPLKAVNVDRDAWVRLAATRRLDIEATPGRIREWRRLVAELGGAL